MFDFIPLEYYAPIYYCACFVMVLFTVVTIITKSTKNEDDLSTIKIIGLLFLFFVLLYMGLRPVSGRYFGDMATYANYFEQYSNGSPILSDKDYLFHYFIQFCSGIMSKQIFFFVCACLYVIPLYLVSKKWFGRLWFYAFLMLAISFSFWAYGTNGIRNGIAGSLFLFAVSRNKRIYQVLWIILAVNIHSSILLPTLGFVIANVYKKPKHITAFWLLCIPLSLLGGGMWETLFANLGFEDNRFAYLTDDTYAAQFSQTGFRWDFLLYSGTAVFAGWYYIVKRGFDDKIYFWLFNTYTFTNACWILVIRASFSNRFAYLSWFMMALVIIYPLLKSCIIPKRFDVLCIILLSYFGFSFLMEIVLK